MPDLASTFNMSIGLLGGLALFLYGMGMMTDGLKGAAGSGLRTVLQRLTGNRFSGALTGATVTAVIQSSSVTTVLVVGFVTAGLMNLQQSVGVIIGANVGTTITAQIIAFKVTKAAMAMIVIGFGLHAMGRRETLRHVGGIIFGLGLVFFGMDLMSQAMTPLQESSAFADTLQRISHPAIAILIAAAFTALVQSSSATTGIAIVLAGQGLITLSFGIALILGANLGTCVTAILAAFGKPTAARRAAFVHVVFNVGGIVLWYGFLDRLAELTTMISPTAPADVDATQRLAAETPRQIANAHTIFNIANALVFIWFTGPIAWLARTVLRERKTPGDERATPRYLDPVYLETPDIGVDRVRMEVARLGGQAEAVLDHLIHPVSRPAHVMRVKADAASASVLFEAIVEYTRGLLQRSLPEARSRELQGLLVAATHINDIVETIATNLGALATEVARHQISVSEPTRDRLGTYGDFILENVRLAIGAIRDTDVDAAHRVIAMRDDVNARTEALGVYLTQRLVTDDPHRATTYRLESDYVEILRRLYYFAKRIAKSVVRTTATADASDPPPPTPDTGADA